MSHTPTSDPSVSYLRTREQLLEEKESTLLEVTREVESFMLSNPGVHDEMIVESFNDPIVFKVHEKHVLTARIEELRKEISVLTSLCKRCGLLEEKKRAAQQ